MSKQIKKEKNIDIDEIFKKISKAKPKAKVVQPQNEKEKKIEVQEDPTKVRKLNKKKGFQKYVNDSNIKKTDEGFKVYTEEELQLGKGGDTELCPFDCQCCF